MVADNSDSFTPETPEALELLKSEVLSLIDQIESMREELFDYQKGFGHQSPSSIPLLSYSDLMKMKDTLNLILGEALEVRRLK